MFIDAMRDYANACRGAVPPATGFYDGPEFKAAVLAAALEFPRYQADQQEHELFRTLREVEVRNHLTSFLNRTRLHARFVGENADVQAVCDSFRDAAQRTKRRSTI